MFIKFCATHAHIMSFKLNRLWQMSVFVLSPCMVYGAKNLWCLFSFLQKEKGIRFFHPVRKQAYYIYLYFLPAFTGTCGMNRLGTTALLATVANLPNTILAIKHLHHHQHHCHDLHHLLHDIHWQIPLIIKLIIKIEDQANVWSNMTGAFTLLCTRAGQ